MYNIWNILNVMNDNQKKGFLPDCLFKETSKNNIKDALEMLWYFATWMHVSIQESLKSWSGFLAAGEGNIKRKKIAELVS